MKMMVILILYVPIDKVVSYSMTNFKESYALSILYGHDYVFTIDSINTKQEADEMLDKILDGVDNDAIKFIHVKRGK